MGSWHGSLVTLGKGPAPGSVLAPTLAAQPWASLAALNLSFLFRKVGSSTLPRSARRTLKTAVVGWARCSRGSEHPTLGAGHPRPSPASGAIELGAADPAKRLWPGKFPQLSAMVSPPVRQEAPPTPHFITTGPLAVAEGIVGAPGDRGPRTQGSQLSSEVCTGLGCQGKVGGLEPILYDLCLRVGANS